MKLLLVEDDPDIQLVARAALKRAGFQVQVAGNGAAALDAVTADRPDVVLLDWMMPEMDGPEVCRRLKHNSLTAGIPVIFLTARSQQAEIARGLAMGAAGYIVKPFDALTLGDEVRTLLERADGRS
jgi:DNA-binding response OmpR family regulator